MTALPHDPVGYAELAVSITADGHVDITRDFGDPALAEHATKRIADALRDTSPPITPPKPGRAVLACHCGAVLDADQLHRQRARGDNDNRPVRPITCKEHRS